MVDVGFWGGAVPTNLDDLEALHAAGVFGFKCFLLDSGVDEFPPLDGRRSTAAMTETARLDALLIVHAEDETEIAAAPDASGSGYARFLGSRPRKAEDVAIARVIDAAAGQRRARPHRAPVQQRRAAAHPAGPRRRGAADRRDLSALPLPRGRGDRRRAHGVQVLPADPRGRQPRPALGRRWPTAPSTWS